MPCEPRGPLSVPSGGILLTNYESLTMAAGFSGHELPERHQQDLVAKVPPGRYSCRIIQFFDPDNFDVDQHDRSLDFCIEILDGRPDLTAWSTIPWSDISAQRDEGDEYVSSGRSGLPARDGRQRPEKKQKPWWRFW